MRKSTMTQPASALAALTAASLLIGGCGDGEPTGPEGAQFSRRITFEELDGMVRGADGASRVEIELFPGSTIAEEVELQEPEDVFEEEEEVEGQAFGFPSDDCDAGTLTLVVGGFEVDVDFDRSTRFEADDSSERITCDEFVARVQQDLGEGRRPDIEAERPPKIPPQAPGDPSFFATELELEDEQGSGDDGSDNEIEINIDGDNLEPGPGPGDGLIRVLGLEIEVRGGVTEIEAKEVAGEVEFEGIVDCERVDPVEGTFSLTGGRIIRIVASTEIEVDADDEDELGSLEEVEDACKAGLVVEAEGEGVAELTDPLTLFAIEVEFEIED